jgi:Fic family protein
MVPLNIVEENSLYRIEPINDKLAVRSKPFSGLLNQFDVFLGSLRSKFKRTEFTSAEAAQVSGSSASTIKSLLTKAQAKSLIQRIGSGKKV